MLCEKCNKSLSPKYDIIVTYNDPNNSKELLSN